VGSQMLEPKSTKSGHLSNFVGGSYVATRDGGSSAPIDPSTGEGSLEAPVPGHIPLVAEMPHGGFKPSGYGQDLSLCGFEYYTRVKHVVSYIGT
jgi:betaine-aldehyde dehydrogenase